MALFLFSINIFLNYYNIKMVIKKKKIYISLFQKDDKNKNFLKLNCFIKLYL